MSDLYEFVRMRDLRLGDKIVVQMNDPKPGLIFHGVITAIRYTQNYIGIEYMDDDGFPQESTRICRDICTFRFVRTDAAQEAKEVDDQPRRRNVRRRLVRKPGHT